MIAFMLKLFGSFVALILGTIVYRLYFHPLAGIPGPRSAAVSNIWHAYHARNGRMLELGKTLHQKFGPMVRVGPNEVWFDSKEAFSKIYSKPPYYYILLSITNNWLQAPRKGSQSPTFMVCHLFTHNRSASSNDPFKKSPWL
jgi:hypothetical protein